MREQEWIYCPVCGNKTRLRVREDSILIKFPLYCPKCRKESLIAIKNRKMNGKLQALLQYAHADGA